MTISIIKWLLTGVIFYLFTGSTFCQEHIDEQYVHECLSLSYPNYEQNISCCEKILESLCENKLIINNRDSIEVNTLLKLSRIYIIVGDLPQADFYANSVLEFADHRFSLESWKYFKTLEHLAHIKQLRDKVSETLQLRERIELLAENLPANLLSEKHKSVIIHNRARMAWMYFLTGRKSDLLELYNKVESIRYSDWYTSDSNEFSNDLQWAAALFHTGELTEALKVIERLYSLSQAKCQQGEYCRLYLYTLALYAEILLEKNEVTKAKNLLQEAITYLPDQQLIDLDELYLRIVELRATTQAEKFTEIETQSAYLVQGIESVRSIEPTHFTQVYAEVANAFLQRGLVHDKLSDIHLAYDYVQQGMSYWEKAVNAASNQDDVRYNLEEYYPIFEVAFNTLFELQQQQPQDSSLIPMALRYFESTRNLKLRTSLRRNTVAKELGVPSHLIQRRQAWQQEIFTLNSDIDQNTTLSVEERRNLEEHRNKLRNKLSLLDNKLLREYPTYVNRLHHTQEFSESLLHKGLAKGNQSLIYFLAADRNLFTIAISPHGQVFHRTPINRDSLAVLIDEIRTLVDDRPYEPDPEVIAKLATHSEQLYKLLIAPVDSILTDRLVIIPDGPTEILPFSLLLDEPVDSEQPLHTWPYLVRDYSISYAYGLELWLQQQTNITTTATKSQILAFAPAFTTSNFRNDRLRNLGDLAYNQDEVGYIKDRFPARTFVSDEAHIAHFRTHASDYSMLHLATHAEANTDIGEYSYLAFAPVDSFDYRLEVGELYGMDIPADLVVLSACETNIGEWQRGEGVIGLERAFAFAGAKSLVTTHWRVSDRASADFMSGFYTELAKGLPKDKALQQAQLSFIEAHPTWLAHPFYWSAYVQKGLSTPITLPKKRPWLMWLISLLTLGGLGFWVYKRRQLST